MFLALRNLATASILQTIRILFCIRMSALWGRSQADEGSRRGSGQKSRGNRAGDDHRLRLRMHIQFSTFNVNLSGFIFQMSIITCENWGWKRLIDYSTLEVEQLNIEFLNIASEEWKLEIKHCTLKLDIENRTSRIEKWKLPGLAMTIVYDSLYVYILVQIYVFLNL